MTKLQKLITKNDLQGALSLLLNSKNLNRSEVEEVIMLNGRLNRVLKNESLDLLPKENTNIELNRIAKAILSYSERQIVENPENNLKTGLSGFVGFGNEPGWILRIEENSIIFALDYGEKTHAYEITQFFLGENIWHFRSNKSYSSEKIFISITVTKETCHDDMSGHEYPYRIEITENFRHYLGTGLMKEKKV